VTESALQHTEVEFLDARRIRLVRTGGPQPSPEHRLAMDRMWDEAVKANPTGLFDGPSVACTGLRWEGPHSVVLKWAPVTYRYYTLRQVPGATALPALFVSVVQPVDDGRLVAGRMSALTAAPGRWQLPGGSVEPPGDSELLDEAALRRHAALELVEETGVDTAPEDLALWSVTRGEYGNIGVIFLAPCRPEPVLRERFAELVSAETALGRNPEFDEIALVRSPADLADLRGPKVDYLKPLIGRYSEGLLRRDD
jgi:8-oxo-dGTP pyrophosphatase MutT (NUDIX family)